MFGWRGRIGLVVPMDNVVIEPELYSLGIEGISFHTVRLTTKERRRMPDQAVALSAVFVEAGVDLIVYACAETSFLGDSDDHQRVCTEIELATGKPCISAVGAMVEALQALAVQRISLVTPYTAVRTQVMRECLSRYGFETIHSVQRDFNADQTETREWYYTNRQPADVARDMALSAMRPEAEALLISATNFRTLSMIETLEQALGKPVVSTNQAIVWAALRHLGLTDQVPGLGRLLHTRTTERSV